MNVLRLAASMILWTVLVIVVAANTPFAAALITLAAGGWLWVIGSFARERAARR